MSKTYVLEKNGVYCHLTNTNAVGKTGDISNAKVFEDIDSAKKMLSHATSKLKGFKIRAYENIVETVTEAAIEAATETANKRKKISPEIRDAVYTASEGRCCICGVFIPYGDFTVDHIIPVAKGGENSIENYQTACLSCNRMKQDLSMEGMCHKMSEILRFQMKSVGIKKRKMRTIKKITEELSRKIESR